MKFWLGAGKPAPDFAELVAGSYSLCAVPITGDMTDPQFLRSSHRPRHRGCRNRCSAGER
jgi:hypothetical protein